MPDSLSSIQTHSRPVKCYFDPKVEYDGNQEDSDGRAIEGYVKQREASGGS